MARPLVGKPELSRRSDTLEESTKMSEAALAVLALLVFAWAVTSRALARHDVTGPIIFTIAGFVLANPDWGVLTADIETGTVHAIAEVTLALVLFSDAARVNLTELRRDVGLPIRLLAIGLPLTLIIGGVTAAIVFDDFTWGLAGFVGAALAPTDAALSAQVINDQRVPGRLRNALNVESGLNDGIATPVVILMLAVAAAQLGLGEEGETAAMGGSAGDLMIGIGLGLLFGLGGATAVNAATRRNWIVSGGRRIATLAVALGAFAAALAIEGNGFIAAFVAGIAFGSRLDDTIEVEEAVELPELGGQLLALVVWFLFGATLLPIAFDHLDEVIVIVFALLALTVFRMLPVAIAMVGSGLAWKDALFLGWFGPRGLASVVFALLALEELGETSEVVLEAVSVVALTVLLSVILHGVTAGPAARSYRPADTAEDVTTSPRATPRGFLYHVRRP
jgi:NhaP-type Na+/H+ or K+/H+ antiporter